MIIYDKIYDAVCGNPPEVIAIRKLVEPVSALVSAAILPLFKEESKVGVHKQTVLVNEPYQINIPGIDWKPSLRGIWRSYYRLEREDLKVFKFNTFKVARLYNPREFDVITSLFKHTLKGLDYATLAYKEGLASDAITTHKAYILHALKGNLSKNSEISALEQQIKNIWSLKEIELINQQVETALEKKLEGRDCSSDIKNIGITLDAKAKEFKEILDQFKKSVEFKEYIANTEPDLSSPDN